MLDAKLEARPPHDVVRVAARRELQGTAGQPMQCAAELTIGVGDEADADADATDAVNSGGERPVVSLEGLRQFAGRAVLFEHQRARDATCQRRGSRQSADP